MKFSCLRENLTKSLNLTSKIIPLKPSLPVLGNLLLETEKGRLKISSTNLEMGIIYKIGAKIEEEGSITIPAKLFTEYINSLPEEKVEIKIKDLDVEINCGNYNAKIKGLAASEFPLIPIIKEEPIIKINPKLFYNNLLYVMFSVSLDESRPILGGVFLDIFKDKIKLVSTDSYRLSEKVIEKKTEVKENINLVVPQRTIQELLRVLSESEEELQISVTEDQILFKTGEIELVSRLIEGKFPAYEQIIPSEWQTKIEAETEKFISAIKTVFLFSKETAGNIKLEALKSNKLIIKSTVTQVGEAQSIVDSKIEGEEIEIAFNAKYLLDVLSTIKSKKVYLEMNGKLNPGVIKPAEEKDYTHIIMPLRI